MYKVYFKREWSTTRVGGLREGLTRGDFGVEKGMFIHQVAKDGGMNI